MKNRRLARSKHQKSLFGCWIPLICMNWLVWCTIRCSWKNGWTLHSLHSSEKGNGKYTKILIIYIYIYPFSILISKLTPISRLVLLISFFSSLFSFFSVNDLNFLFCFSSSFDNYKVHVTTFNCLDVVCGVAVTQTLLFCKMLGADGRVMYGKAKRNHSGANRF